MGIQWYNSIKTDDIHRMKNIEKKIASKSRIFVRQNLFIYAIKAGTREDAPQVAVGGAMGRHFLQNGAAGLRGFTSVNFIAI